MSTVGIAELRQNLSTYLKRVEAGESLVVTDHNRPVARLVPLEGGMTTFEQLIADGRLRMPQSRPRFAPVRMDTRGISPTDVLIELRGED